MENTTDNFYFLAAYLTLPPPTRDFGQEKADDDRYSAEDEAFLGHCCVFDFQIYGKCDDANDACISPPEGLSCVFQDELFH